MEPPIGITTNVHKIGDVLEVDWIAFTYAHDQSGLPDTSLDASSLYSVESNYRQAGGYVYRESRSDRLWVFHWPHHGKDTLVHGSYYPAKAPGISEISRGVIRPISSDSSYGNPNNVETGAKRKRSDSAEGLIKLNHQAVSHNSSIPAPPNGNEQPPEFLNDDHIRSCLLRAIQMRYLYVVTQSLSYMPLSEGFFFKWHGQSDHSFMASSSYRLREVVPLWSLKSIWHTNGSLLISYSHVNNRYVHIPDPKTSGRELVLAPFGWLAKIDMKSIPDSSSLLGSMAESKLDRDIQWRSQCGHVLQQYGLALTGDVEWVLVSIFPNHPGEVSNVLEWPKELCYVMTDSIYDQNQGNRREQLNTYFWKDPLVEADTWFKDRKARESLIKEQLQARSKTHDHDKPQGQEEVLPHLQSKYDELIDQQILAGIYPTPPDASKTHTNIRSDGSPRVPECSEDSDIMDLKDELAEYATPALDGSIDVANYNPLKDDELFADMDGDIDGDNGVTEDDFRFFDEPDGPCITAIESTLPDLMDFREPGDEHQASKEELLDDLRGSLINHSLNTIVDEQAEQEITKPSHTRIVQIVSSPMRHIYEKVSEIPCKLNSVQQLDAKYISTGKYASNNGQQPLAAKPGITVEQEKHIPLLNTKSIVNPATTDELSTGTLHKHDAFFNPLRFRQGSTLSAQDERNFDAYLKSCLCFDIANKSEASTENRHTRSSLVSPSTLESQGHAFIQLAQIVADQSISYGYILRQQDHSQTNNDQKEDLQNINRIITQSQTDNRALTLQEIVSLESNSPAKTEPARLLATSTIRVKRGEAIMDMSFAAIEYWKELGIKPLHNVKNVTAFCLYPDDEAYRIGSAKFLQQMSDAYRNLNLGSHSLGDPKLPSNINGLVPIPGLEALAINFKSVQGYCSQFGSSLLALENRQNTILIYIIRPIESNVSLMDICALFQHIFEAYASPYRKLGQPSDMILQIIPSSLISSSLKQVLPRLKQYSNISKMVYGRCPRMESSDSAYTPGSMIQLAEPLPIIIDFKLNPDGSSHPLKGSETFHLAYACTNDQRWLNVALIDSFGSKQWNASYYLGECTEFIPTLAEIAKEIFDTVQDAANSRLNYSLVMVKTIKWTLSEIKIWKQLAQKSKVSLSMVVYDLECPLDLVDPGMAVDLKLLHEELPSALPILDTSSLDAGIVKTEEQDNFTRLVDTNNQAYWFPSKETLAVDNGSLTIQHHLASGYLMYRNMPLITIYVQDSTHATEMMSIVETYHHLKTLSQARCIDDNLPWHLAIADAARHGVEQNIHSSVVG